MSDFIDYQMPIYPAKRYQTDVCVQIGSKVYYGKSLKGKYSEKIGILTKSIARVSISIFSSKQKRKSSIGFKELKYNQKLSYRIKTPIIKSKKFSSYTSSPLTPILHDILPKILNSIPYSKSDKALKFLSCISLVSKDFKKIAAQVKWHYLFTAKLDYRLFQSFKELDLTQFLNFAKTFNDPIHSLHLEKFEKNEISQISHLSHLKSFVVFNEIFNESDMAHLVTNHPRLEEISFNWAFTQKGINHLAKLARLKKFTLQGVESQLTTQQVLAQMAIHHPYIEKLSLSNTGFRVIPWEEIIQFKNLKKLQLSCLVDQPIPPLRALKHLKTLNIMGNQQTFSFLNGLINLKKFHCTILGRGYQKTDSSAIGSLENLEELSWHGGKLTFSFDRLRKLQRLILSNNHFKNGILSLENQAHLKTLKINSNYLKQIPSFDSLTNLSHLEISCNKLKVMGSLSALKNLKAIAISSPHLKNRYQPDLEELEKQGVKIHLKSLPISPNKIPF